MFAETAGTNGGAHASAIAAGLPDKAHATTRAITAGRALLSGEAKTATQARQIAGYADPRGGRPSTPELYKAALKAGYGGKGLPRLRSKALGVIEKALDANHEGVALGVLKVTQDAGVEEPDTWREGSATAAQRALVLRCMRHAAYLALLHGPSYYAALCERGLSPLQVVVDVDADAVIAGESELAPNNSPESDASSDARG